MVLPHLPPRSGRGTLLVELRPDWKLMVRRVGFAPTASGPPDRRTTELFYRLICLHLPCGLRVPGWARTSVHLATSDGFAVRCLILSATGTLNPHE